MNCFIILECLFNAEITFAWEILANISQKRPYCCLQRFTQQCSGRTQQTPDICLPTRKNKSRTLWIFQKSLYYCPVKEQGVLNSFIVQRLLKNSGALQKPFSASRTFISNCLQGLSVLSLRREICNCPIAPNTPRKSFHCSVQSHL